MIDDTYAEFCSIFKRKRIRDNSARFPNNIAPLEAFHGGQLLSEEAVAERAQVVGDPSGEVLRLEVGDGRAARPAQVRRRQVRRAARQLCEWPDMVNLVTYTHHQADIECVLPCRFYTLTWTRFTWGRA